MTTLFHDLAKEQPNWHELPEYKEITINEERVGKKTNTNKSSAVIHPLED